MASAPAARSSAALAKSALASALAGAAVVFGGTAFAATAPGAATTDYPVGTIAEKVTTAHDETQQYALYLPTGYGTIDKSWPILFVLDPRGRAIPGIERFLPSAERHGYIVCSSYQSRSDTLRDVNFHALDALLLDVQRRFRVDTRRFYLAGMSGTAHASWRFGQILEKHVAGVIAAVGGVQTETQGPPGDARFAYYGITGTTDFNYQEVMELEAHLLERGMDHRIVVFDGRHGWPPREFTNEALDWMEFQAVKRGLASPDPGLIDAAFERATAAAAAAEDVLEELRRRRDIVRDFQGLRRVDAELEAVRRLEADPQVRKRRAQERKLATAEHSYFTMRVGPWLHTMRDRTQPPPTVRESLVALRVGALQKRAADRENLSDAHSALRLLESLHTSVAFYLPGQFEPAGDFERAARSLEIAVAIFPKNPGGHWRLAAVYVRAGRHKAALEAIQTAATLGRVDLERLEADPDWEPLRGRPEWQELIAAITTRTD